MEVKISSWTDADRSCIGRIRVEVEPVAYRTAPYAYWKLLIAGENVDVERGRVAFVKLKRVNLPGNTIVSPLASMRHALGVVLDVYESYPPRTRVEDRKTIEFAAFLPVESGRIENGDLIGVVKVFVVGVSTIDRMTSLKAPEIEIELEELQANVVTREGRRKMWLKEYRYRRRHIAEWIPLVADERVEVEKGEVGRIKIRDARLSPQTIPVPLSIMRHPFGTVIDVVEDRIRKIEEARMIREVVFMPVKDGIVERGDLIGVLNNYHVSVGSMPSHLVLLGEQRVVLVEERGEGIARKEFELKPFGYKRSEIGFLHPVVAAENRKIRANEVTELKIEEITLPTGTIVQPLSARNHAMGIMLDVRTDGMRLVEEDKTINSAIFLPIVDGEVEKGDLIGVLNVYNVAVLSPEQLQSFRVF